jgi:hypothetical protein
LEDRSLLDDKEKNKVIARRTKDAKRATLRREKEEARVVGRNNKGIERAKNA